MTASDRSTPSGERLQKVLAHAGLASRRAVEEMIEAGRIKVNGKRARLGQRVDAAKDLVEVDGSAYPLDSTLVYYLLNKPPGVVSSADDPEGRTTVVDIVDVGARVWPVGRLDRDSEGALILTNDGELTMRLTHPRYHVPRTYLVEVEGAIGHGALRTLRSGVELEDGVTAPADVELEEKTSQASLLKMTIREGRNRQIRRMAEAVGHPVRRLVRMSVGPLGLGRLKPGAFRRLGPTEVHALYAATGDEPSPKDIST